MSLGRRPSLLPQTPAASIRAVQRSLTAGVLGTVAALLLAGCGSGTMSNSVAPLSVTSGTDPTPPAPVPITAGFTGGTSVTGTKDAVVATPSVSAVSGVLGATQTVSITFASNDGRLITGFGVTDTLGTLPAGWSGPAAFACSAVSSGSNCVLNLVFAPTAAGGGTLTINYEFIDNALQSKTGNSLTLSYTATANDNVLATALPTGQIDAAVGGNQAVVVNFITDDGNAATDLAVTTDLSQLPAGWSAAAPTFACAIVRTGNGCELALTYAPTAAGSATLTLSYSYQDDSGAAKTGTLSIPYYAAAANTVVAAVSPAPQVTAVQKTGGQPVAVTFTTNDGKQASGFGLLTDLKSLPAGWSASGGATCGSVSTGNGCQLHLTYAPTALASGTLALQYAYTDGSGASQTGLTDIGYAATTNDNVVGTPAPSGQINAVVSDGSQMGNGTQAVTITFTTDDGRPATALQVTSNLTTLPAGWSSSANALSCSGLDADNVCKLTLTYAPSAAGNGTLLLNYSYDNNANEMKTGTVSIPYRATTNDTVAATPSQGTLATVRTGASAAATISFATDDGNPASTLAITSGLNPLPAGWSAASTAFKCATVSAGTACSLSLTYAPTTAVGSSTLTLGYSYLNDAGYPSTGSVSIGYSAYTPYLYVANTAGALSACALTLNDGIAACSAAGSGFAAPAGIALYGNFAYVTNTAGNSVSRCTLDAVGALADCGAVGGLFSAPTAIATSPTAPFVYVEQSTGLAVCAIAPSDGSLSGCVAAGTAFEPLAGVALSADGSHAYSVHAVVDTLNPVNSTDVIDVCLVSAVDGTLGACVANVASTPLAAVALAVQNDDLYVTTTAGSLYLCPIGAFSTISSCQLTAANSNAAGISFKDTTAFLGTGGATLLACPVNTGGTLGVCTTVSNPTFNGTAGMAVR
jgi:hypothetical protein